MNGLTDEGLTPLQDLVMETLAARYRLGERTWTFTDHPSVKRAMRALEGMGLIGWKSGVTENTTRAWLSAEGRRLFVTADYVPPIFRPKDDPRDEEEKILAFMGRSGYSVEAIVATELRKHHFDYQDKGDKPDDPGWHRCRCTRWQGYWVDFANHQGAAIAAALKIAGRLP